jgi:hypothetical protein
MEHVRLIGSYITYHGCASRLIVICYLRKFQASLDAIGWPKAIPDGFALSKEHQINVETAFKELLLLQEP